MLRKDSLAPGPTLSWVGLKAKSDALTVPCWAPFEGGAGGALATGPTTVTVPRIKVGWMLL